MKILVFGKTGQVAQELQRQADVTALGREQADLTDPPSCAQAIREAQPDIVINAAAYTAVDAAESDEELATVVNAHAPGAMAQTCADLGIPFVHISTDYVFRGDGVAPWSETDAVAPQNAYGRSKLAGEQAVRDAAGTALILRTSWVFSAHGNNFVKTMLRLAESRDTLSVVADQVGCPTPAEDIAGAILTIAHAMHAGHDGGIYHFGGQPAVCWADFARAIFAGAGKRIEVVDIPSTDFPTPASRPLNSRLNCDAIARDFGVAPSSWERGLVRVLKELECNDDTA